MTIRDCVITETAAQDDSGLFSDGETAERCVVYGNRSGQAGGSSPVGFWMSGRSWTAWRLNRTSSDMLSGDGFTNCDALGCVAYAHAGDGFQGSVFQYSVAFTNVKVGFYLGAKRERATTQGSRNWDIYGLKDHDVDDMWNEMAITYNTGPGCWQS